MSIYILAILLGLCLSSCDIDTSGSSDGQFEDFKVIEETSLVKNNTEVTGTGKLMATSSLRTVNDSIHIKVKGQFLSEQSYLVLNLYFDSFKSNNGLKIKILSDTDKNNIIIQYSEPNRFYTTLLTLTEVLDIDHSFELRFELHNSLNQQRQILIWNEMGFQGNKTRTNKDILSIHNSDYNSKKNGDVFYSWGSGLNWGVRLNNIRLGRIYREAPYVSNH